MALTDLNRIDGLRQIRQKKNNAFNPNSYEKSGSSEQVSTGLEALIFRTCSGGCTPPLHSGVYVSGYFNNLAVFFLKPFTYALFLAILFSLFYHLGTSCLMGCGLSNPIITGFPDGFSNFYHYVQNSGNIYLFNTTETPESQGDEAFISDIKPLNMCQSRDEILKNRRKRDED